MIAIVIVSSTLAFLKLNEPAMDGVDLLETKSVATGTIANKIVRVSINESWPDSFMGKDGKPQGLFIDMLDEIASLMRL